MTETVTTVETPTTNKPSMIMKINKENKAKILQRINDIKTINPDLAKNEIVTRAFDDVYGKGNHPIIVSSSCIHRYWHKATGEASTRKPRVKAAPVAPAVPAPAAPAQGQNNGSSSEIKVLCPHCDTLIQVRWSKV